MFLVTSVVTLDKLLVAMIVILVDLNSSWEDPENQKNYNLTSSLNVWDECTFFWNLVYFSIATLIPLGSIQVFLNNKFIFSIRSSLLKI